jgi:predicted RNase H-like HicB family nuclease
MKVPPQAKAFGHKVVFSRARDGRWIADVPALPLVTAFGFTRKEALAAVQMLALKAIVDRMGSGWRATST